MIMGRHDDFLPTHLAPKHGCRQMKRSQSSERSCEWLRRATQDDRRELYHMELLGEPEDRLAQRGQLVHREGGLESETVSPSEGNDTS